MPKEPMIGNRRKRPANVSPKAGLTEDAADVIRMAALIIGPIDFRAPNIPEEGVAALFPWRY